MRDKRTYFLTHGVVHSLQFFPTNRTSSIDPVKGKITLHVKPLVSECVYVVVDVQELETQLQQFLVPLLQGAAISSRRIWKSAGCNVKNHQAWAVN